MAIRKQVYELTPQDLDDYAAWEFALDEETEEGQDEATVRPIERSGPIDPGYGMCVVKAEFLLNDGTSCFGFVSPYMLDLLDTSELEGDGVCSQTQPSIVTNNGHVMFWYGIMKPTPEMTSRSYQLLGGKSPSQVFPIRYRSVVDVTSGPITGEIRGFMFVEQARGWLLRRKEVVRVIQG